MNHLGKNNFKALPVCPRCGMDSGRRAVSDEARERYYVLCDSCGYFVRAATQAAATKKWDKYPRNKR